MKETRIAIFDDSEHIRKTLSLLFLKLPGYTLAGAFAQADELVQRIEEVVPDVVLMDIDMPEVNGIEAVKILRKKFPELPVIMLTVFDDDEKIFDAICAGADGYILKTKSFDDLSKAIQEILSGGSPMSPSIARKVLQLFRSQNTSSAGEEYHLSEREKEVLKLLVNGDSYKMIADKLGIGYTTVNAHLKKIYRKLQVNSLGEAISKTLRNRLFLLVLI